MITKTQRKMTKKDTILKDDKITIKMPKLQQNHNNYDKITTKIANSHLLRMTKFQLG